jgi:hypothetical protein
MFGERPNPDSHGLASAVLVIHGNATTDLAGVRLEGRATRPTRLSVFVVNFAADEMTQLIEMVMTHEPS